MSFLFLVCDKSDDNNKGKPDMLIKNVRFESLEDYQKRSVVNLKTVSYKKGSLRAFFLNVEFIRWPIIKGKLINTWFLCVRFVEIEIRLRITLARKSRRVEMSAL
jgi:hypothetical protein